MPPNAGHKEAKLKSSFSCQGHSFLALKTLGEGPNHLCLNKLSGGFDIQFWLENHCSLTLCNAIQQISQNAK